MGERERGKNYPEQFLFDFCSTPAFPVLKSPLPVSCPCLRGKGENKKLQESRNICNKKIKHLCCPSSSALVALLLCPVAKQELKIRVSKLHRGFCWKFQRFFFFFLIIFSDQFCCKGAVALPSLWGQTLGILHTNQVWLKTKIQPKRITT